MNQLNSVLLEGFAMNEPVDIEHQDNNSSCYFLVESNRIAIISGSNKEEKSTFTIQAFGKVAEICRDRLRSGLCLRVVGRIRSKQENDHIDFPEVFIVAEHIEIKPTVDNLED